MKNKSLPYRLTLLIISITSLVLAGLLVINYRTSRRIMIDRIGQNIRSVSEQSLRYIMEELGEIEEKVIRHSIFLLDRELDSETEVERVLRNLTESDPRMAGASLLFNTEGEPVGYLYSILPGRFLMFRGSVAQLPSITDPAAGVWSGPRWDSLYREQVLTYSVPVFRRLGDSLRISGSLDADIHLRWINGIMNELKVYKTGVAYLVASDGRFITHPDSAFVGRGTLADVAREFRSPQILSLVDSLSLGRSGVLHSEDYFRDSDRGLITYQPVPGKGWYIVIFFREAEYLEELNRLTEKLAWIGGSGLILLSVLIFLIIRRLTRPLVHLSNLTEKISMGEWDVSLPETGVRDEAGKLSDSIRSLQAELKKYIENLKVTLAEKERIESDIRIAGQIQKDLIPATFPDPGTLNGLDVFGRIVPAQWISGDLFEFRRTGDNSLLFMIGDVTGKGVPASLFMAMTRTLVVMESGREEDPPKILETVNNQLCENNTNSVFVTAILGVVNLSTGQVDYCNAGHVLPYVSSPGRAFRKLEEAHGLPLGLVPGTSYSSGRFRLEKGGCFLCFSDGVTEAENGGGEFFGETGVEEFLAKSLQMQHSSEEIVNSLLVELQRFSGKGPGSDDITILALCRREDGSPGG